MIARGVQKGAWLGAGNPVVELKPRHPFEFTDVVGHQRGLQAQGMGGDQGVEGTDRCALMLQISPQIAIGPQGRLIKRQDRQGRQKQIQSLPVPRRAAIGDAIGQLRRHC